MSSESSELVRVEIEQLQNEYKATMGQWITAIKQEEALVSAASHSVADVDAWKNAHFAENEVREKVIALQKQYEEALRKKFYDF